MEDISREVLCSKAVLTLQEAAIYTGYALRYLQKLAASGQIPHGKPNGKSIFFDRKVLENWLLGKGVTVKVYTGEPWAKEDIDDLVRWVCAKYGHGINPERAIAEVANLPSGNSLQPDAALDYLYEHYRLEFLRREELDFDKGILREEKARRSALGLPLFWDDWSEDIPGIFIDLGIHDRIDEFYDTPTSHSVDGAYKWISKKVRDGKVSPAELKRQVEAIRAKETKDHRRVFGW